MSKVPIVASGSTTPPISQLFDKAQAAVADVDKKRLKVEETKAAFDAASQDFATANRHLEELRNEINVALGGVLGAQNPRVTISQ